MTPKKALEFKGRMLSLTRARILDPDLAAITAQLQDFARQMPRAAQGMPVVLEAEMAVDLGAVLAAMREVGMQPLGVTDGVLAASARQWGLAVLAPDGPGRTGRSAGTVEPAGAPAARRPTRIVTEPVRSGQQIYAAEGDLVVLSAVSAGAEVVADGCVHVYGALRGRALAGARGDAQARIFCRRFEAELVAVAGVYAVAEQMQSDWRGKPAQVRLADGKLRIEGLDG
ncbi:septum site-determining protein MinC [Fontimonas thermophila]|uniref:Probable septum site-determining protein MinC n=1 Tax=Fontimonas thermophila TaxID=1076937 RepID=A0A1I2J8L3_9GAMM|nr:septum site-determining protein MinC [Fontimonas thermophila]SFF49061.1 septum site-determining protein MinC [Fontimonas thermophila]